LMSALARVYPDLANYRPACILQYLKQIKLTMA